MSVSPFAARLLERTAAVRPFDELRIDPGNDEGQAQGSPSLSRDEFAHEITELQALQLERYYNLLRKWNSRTNLTSLALAALPSNETIDRLFLEPLVASRFIEDLEMDVVDIGSGGGSPALPLKIFRKRLSLTMVESRGRKAAFLREAVRHLELTGVSVLTERVEEVAIRSAAVADMVTIRAVRVDRQLSDSVRRLLKPSGCLLTFGPSDVPGGFGLVQRTALAIPESFVSLWTPQR